MPPPKYWPFATAQVEIVDDLIEGVVDLQSDWSRFVTEQASQAAPGKREAPRTSA